MTREIEATVDELIDRARGLATGDRALLGITGPPGAGKSTVARQIVDAIGPGGGHRRDGRLSLGAACESNAELIAGTAAAADLTIRLRD